MATAEFGGQKPPVILTVSHEEAQALLSDLGDYEYAISSQSNGVRLALKKLLDS